MKEIVKILLFIIMGACSIADQENSEDAGKYSANDIVGSWCNLSMKVTYLNSDSVFNVPEGQWEEILRIKPIRTTYLKDSSFLSEYFKLDGSPLFTSSGTWYIKNDSLSLFSNGSVSTYKFSMDKNIGRFVGIIDWNEDGIRNEIYDGKQKKL